MSYDWSDEEEKGDIPKQEIFPLLNYYIQHIKELPQDEQDQLDGNQQVFYNIITDKEFKNHKDVILGSVAILCEIPEFEITHGLEHHKKAIELYDKCETFLVKINAVEGDTYDTENRNLNKEAQRLVDNFHKSFQEYEGKKVISTQSLHIMFDMVGIFFSCIYDSLNIIEVFTEMGI